MEHFHKDWCSTFASEDEILPSEDEMAKWKEPLIEKMISRQNTNLMQIVYGKSGLISSTSNEEAHDSSEDEDSDDGEFFKPKGELSKVFLKFVFFPVNLRQTHPWT